MTERVASPCVSICALDGDDVCVGCFRTGMEVSQWGVLEPAAQREVLARCRRRMQGEPALCWVLEQRALRRA
ncbi:DUF1289 domain-containing protein [Isoalcanivorax beigongshangi]|uniref:DUF1289 domain-containing protein n=1 Tax=Isoalcanivorax beigongshangi TaxID=3238810 RepID=A0ABV4AIR9_9GAMM